jgi:hypothetical protein
LALAERRFILVFSQEGYLTANDFRKLALALPEAE